MKSGTIQTLEMVQFQGIGAGLVHAILNTAIPGSAIMRQGLKRLEKAQ